MGLRINTYSNIRLSANEPDSSAAFGVEETDPYFDRIGLNPGIYTADFIDSIKVGSYTFYNSWREMLSQLALGMPATTVWESPEMEGKPFYELIDFSDCSGILGTDVCCKLLDDFEESRGTIESNISNRAIKAALTKTQIEEWSDDQIDEFWDLYDEFIEALRTAAGEEGCIEFG